jgi:hypothetical protein
MGAIIQRGIAEFKLSFLFPAGGRTTSQSVRPFRVNRAHRHMVDDRPEAVTGESTGPRWCLKESTMLAQVEKSSVSTTRALSYSRPLVTRLIFDLL